MPMLAESSTSCVRIRAGLHTVSTIFAAMRPASSVSATLRSKITNSSPPRRETVSSERTAPGNRGLYGLEDLVPDKMRERVIDPLKLVEVEKKHRPQSARALPLQDGLDYAPLEKHPVSEGGETVVDRHLVDLRVLFLEEFRGGIAPQPMG